MSHPEGMNESHKHFYNFPGVLWYWQDKEQKYEQKKKIRGVPICTMMSHGGGGDVTLADSRNQYEEDVKSDFTEMEISTGSSGPEDSYDGSFPGDFMFRVSGLGPFSPHDFGGDPEKWKAFGKELVKLQEEKERKKQEKDKTAIVRNVPTKTYDAKKLAMKVFELGSHLNPIGTRSTSRAEQDSEHDLSEELESEQEQIAAKFDTSKEKADIAMDPFCEFWKHVQKMKDNIHHFQQWLHLQTVVCGDFFIQYRPSLQRAINKAFFLGALFLLYWILSPAPDQSTILSEEPKLTQPYVPAVGVPMSSNEVPVSFRISCDEVVCGEVEEVYKSVLESLTDMLFGNL